MADDQGYQAVVEKIIPDGRNGPYAVARSKEIKGTVTFSLDFEVWQEKQLPKPGTHVMLYGVIKKDAGWRAEKGRLFKPSDEQTATKMKE